MNKISKPQKRGALRRYLGREYFILKRRLRLLKDGGTFAKVLPQDIACQHLLIKHRSMLLRPLKEVDMYLQHNKITNLRLAIAPINGVVIQPGQTFSLWRMVGRPTASKGYLEGLVLENGRIGKGIGGGLCQLGNLLYWMALHSDLTITERWRHGFDVFPDINRTIPFACGATLAYNYIDLQLRNDTPHAYKINLWLDDEYLNGELLTSDEPHYEFEVYETDHCMLQQVWGGYTRHNKIWKKKIDAKTREELSHELVSENHAIMMYAPLLQEGASNNV